MILHAKSRTLAVVCGMALLAARAGSSQDDIRELKLRDWQPRSMLKTKTTRINLPKFPVIDVHNHLGGGAATLTGERVSRYLREMDDAGVRTVVNLDGGWDDKLRESVAALDAAHPGRFLTFALIDLRGFDQDDWSARETTRLRKSFEAGAKGLKFHKSLGLYYRDKEGKLLGIDDPRLDPIWALCGEMNKPVMIHTADPAAFFTPLDRYNERWHELNEHPNWLFFGDKFPSRNELLEQRNRVIARHPQTTFIGAHFGNNPEDLETVGKWLDKYPNLNVDIDARISELGRQPYSCRRFFIKYQDRILFGTDTNPKADAYRLYYRFLETDDEYFDTAQSHHRQGFWMIYGIFLPEPVLKKIYHANAARLLGLPQIGDVGLRSTSPADVDYTAAVDKLQDAIRFEVRQKQLPAFSISLVDGDLVVWSDGFGFQDAEKRVPASAETVYRVGSVSKLFTDIAVMQLVEEGGLDLDAPVQKYLPEFEPENPYGIPITLRQMMSHRSGLVRESPIGNYFDPDEPTLAQTVASLNQTSLVYRPETKTKYSNAAVAVVGAVLERQLAVSHPEQVRRTIFDPLDMHGSSFVVTPKVEPRLAAGWMRTYDGRRFEAPTFLLGTGPAGNLYSSVLDLSKFLTCLFNNGRTASGPVLQPETLELMTTAINNAEGKPEGFGIGFHVQDLDGFKKIGHGGAVYGFSTQLEALPQRRIGVAAASALDGSNGVVSRLADYALRVMIAAQDNKPPPAYRRTEPIPRQRALELVGMYREVDGDRFARITQFGGDIFLQRGSFRYQLRAAADDGTIVTDDAVGFGTEVKLQDSDRLVVSDIEFERLADEPPADIPEHWRGLIGEYGWDHNTLYILEDNGRLYALIEWFYYYPLDEVSENVFEFPDYGLYHGEGLKFTRDAGGIATDVVAAEVKFVRREVGTKDGETFRITPVKPIDELRSAAMAAAPPVEPGDFREAELVELVELDPTIKLDIRYASDNNFTGAVFYKQARAFMQRPAAEAVVRANKRLQERGLGLLIHDAYRPWHVTKMFWDATPDGLKRFVANPAQGSRHNRGCAVDLTLYDRATGESIQMVAGYDEFSPRSFPMYPGGTSRQRWYRQLLRRTMADEGFTIYEYEWWHFDYQDWKQYRIGNLTFDEMTD